MGLIDLSIPDEVTEVFPYIGDQRGRFRLGDLVEFSGLSASTCHKVLHRMARYGIITKQSKRSRIWIKKFDTISNWIQRFYIMEVKDVEKKREGILKIDKEKQPF